jgi:hypothetical protein
MGALLLFDILQNDRERLKIGVNVGYYRKLHVLFTLRFRTHDTFRWHRPNSPVPSQ